MIDESVAATNAGDHPAFPVELFSHRMAKTSDRAPKSERSNSKTVGADDDVVGWFAHGARSTDIVISSIWIERTRVDMSTQDRVGPDP